MQIKTKLPENWELPEEYRQWVLNNYVAENDFINKEAEKFFDHHRANGNKKAHWFSAWRYWWHQRKIFLRD